MEEMLVFPRFTVRIPRVNCLACWVPAFSYRSVYTIKSPLWLIRWSNDIKLIGLHCIHAEFQTFVDCIFISDHAYLYLIEVSIWPASTATIPISVGQLSFLSTQSLKHPWPKTLTHGQKNLGPDFQPIFLLTGCQPGQTHQTIHTKHPKIASEALPLAYVSKELEPFAILFAVLRAKLPCMSSISSCETLFTYSFRADEHIETLMSFLGQRWTFNTLQNLPLRKK